MAGESLCTLLNVSPQLRQAPCPGPQFVFGEAISVERQWLVGLGELVRVEHCPPLFGLSVCLESVDSLHFFDDVWPEGVFSVKAIGVALN